MRIVIDTNVLVSAFFWGGLPRKLVDLAVASELRAITSLELLTEYTEVLAEDFHLPHERIILAIRDVLSYSEVITTVTNKINDLRDPDDEKVIACAIAGNADYIITGDNDLLIRGVIKDIKIIRVRDFLDTHELNASSNTP